MTVMLRSLGASFVAIVCICTIGGSTCAQTSKYTVVDLTFPKAQPAPKVDQPAVKPAVKPAEKSTESFRPISHSFPAPAALPDNDKPKLTFPVAADLPPKYTTFNIPMPGMPAESDDQAATDDPPVVPPPTQSGDPEAVQASEDATNAAPEAVPTLTEPYWVGEVVQRAGAGERVLGIAYEQTIWDALTHSPYVKAVQLVPQINEAKIIESNGVFDPTPFVDSIFNDNSDPWAIR